ncbi:hypothetical protein K2224_27110 [Streptomyces sp. BHT-5-2]|uniref:hypothetical protein n=1 Tax=Streptomyces sp. BHT-5-2 TaxID=2866715 RepID=UPI001C8DA704|nr:hypothetical protein [Streptomyces sp. BHT-5-2]QZL06386.1 hypothetical protein K2224_27110 [Streptomyces sp. BHT-5-2]
MSNSDDAAALRARRAQRQTLATGSQPASHHGSGRPADLVVTSDVIPIPVTVSASGDLTHDEIDQLGACERVVENLGTAFWLAGKALQSIRDRRLYRKTHDTFEEYVQERWEISVRAAYQMIEEWALTEHLNTALGKPPIASHTRALLPIAARYGLDVAADMYQQLGDRADKEGIRLTAAITTKIVKAVLKAAGKDAEEEQFIETARQLMSAGELPLKTSPDSKQRAALPTASVQQQPRALAPASNLQNFADDRGTATGPKVVPIENHIESTVKDNASNSDHAQEFFLGILARAGSLERDLSGAEYAGPYSFKATSAREAVVRVLKRIVERLQAPHSHD